MRVLSLFNGIGCIWLALDRLGIKVEKRYSSEIDKYAIKVNDYHYSDTIQLGDVQGVNAKELGWIDLVVFGSPCQGFSFAGKGLNFEDPRSKLFFEAVRILNEIREINPNVFFLMENVRMKKESEEIISYFLKVSPIEINSSLVSAQNRRRLYWTNISGVRQPKDKNIFWDSVFEENAQCFYYNEKSFRWIFKDPQRAAKYKEYQPYEKVKMQMIEASHRKGYSNQRCFGIRDIQGVRYISPVECERLQTIPDNYTNVLSNYQRYNSIGNAWTVDVITHILSYMNQGIIISKPKAVYYQTSLFSTLYP